MFIRSAHDAEQHGHTEHLTGIDRYQLVCPQAGSATDESVFVDIVRGSAPDVQAGGSTAAVVSASVVLDGTLRREGETLPRGSVVLGRHDSTGSADGASAATVLVVRSRTGALDVAPLTIFTLDERTDVPAHNPTLGFFDMKARMLVDGPSEGTRSFTLGLGTFAPGTGCHALHRHARAAEFFYLWEGSGAHLTGDGSSHPIEAGDLVYVPRDEWHGFRNTGTVQARAFFGYLGVDSLPDAGYEVK